MSKIIKCRNEDDVQISFSYEEEADFFLISLDGAYSVSNNVVTSANTLTDGSTYQGSTTIQRNIVITAEFDTDYQEKRDYLYKSFKPKSPGTLFYTEGEEERQIDYYQIKEIVYGIMSWTAAAINHTMKNSTRPMVYSWIISPITAETTQ